MSKYNKKTQDIYQDDFPLTYPQMQNLNVSSLALKIKKNPSLLNKSAVDHKNIELSLDAIHYTNINLLKQFLTHINKISPARSNGNSFRVQKLITNAIKRARHIGLLSSVPRGEFEENYESRNN